VIAVEHEARIQQDGFVSQETWREWAPDIAVAAGVFVLGLLEVLNTPAAAGIVDQLWIVVPTAAAAGLSRRLPSAALALVWFAGAMQVFATLPFLYAELAFALVAFGTARWGHPLTVLASGVSIPLAGVLAVRYVDFEFFDIVVGRHRYQTLIEIVRQFSGTWQVGAAIVGMGLLGVPWLAGLTLRQTARAATSRASQRVAEEEAARAQRESHQAQEIARLREEQNQLARDVHDVVGHSLAVILAQAESAQFLDEADTGALRLSMANIAKSARSSLQDVRQVLSSGGDPVAGPGELRDLVEGVRASGHEIVFDEVGTARPLPPELATVGYRVLQEMLTNAIRHGSRDGEVRVELHWAGELRIEVVNQARAVEAPGESGHGIGGMRRRLESVGGRLDVRRRGEGEEQTFTATAWLPTRTVVA
jgi:signal transduction histidine kinase